MFEIFNYETYYIIAGVLIGLVSALLVPAIRYIITDIRNHKERKANEEKDEYETA